MIRPVSFRTTLAAEWIKARSLSVTWVLPVIALLLALVNVALSIWAHVALVKDARLHEREIGKDLGTLVSSDATLTAVLLGVLALVLITGDMRYGVLNASFVANGSKGRLVGAKLLVGALLGLVWAVIVTVLMGLILSVAGAALGVDAPAGTKGFWIGSVGIVALCVLTTLMAMGCALLTRGTLGGVILFLILQWGLFFGGLILDSVGSAKGRFEFFHVISEAMPLNQFMKGIMSQTWGESLAGIGAYALWCVVVCVIGAAVFMRRDLGATH